MQEDCESEHYDEYYSFVVKNIKIKYKILEAESLTL